MNSPMLHGVSNGPWWDRQDSRSTAYSNGAPRLPSLRLHPAIRFLGTVSVQRFRTTGFRTFPGRRSMRQAICNCAAAGCRERRSGLKGGCLPTCHPSFWRRFRERACNFGAVFAGHAAQTVPEFCGLAGFAERAEVKAVAVCDSITWSKKSGPHPRRDAPDKLHAISAFSLLLKPRSLSVSLIGGNAETQVMLDCKNNITAGVEVIPIHKVNV